MIAARSVIQAASRHVLGVQLGALLERGLEVRQPAGREVVDDVDLVAVRDEGVDEVGADEAGAAGDEGLHGPTQPRAARGANPVKRAPHVAPTGA